MIHLFITYPIIFITSFVIFVYYNKNEIQISPSVVLLFISFSVIITLSLVVIGRMITPTYEKMITVGEIIPFNDRVDFISTKNTKKSNEQPQLVFKVKKDTGETVYITTNNYVIKTNNIDPEKNNKIILFKNYYKYGIFAEKDSFSSIKSIGEYNVFLNRPYVVEVLNEEIPD